MRRSIITSLVSLLFLILLYLSILSIQLSTCTIPTSTSQAHTNNHQNIRQNEMTLSNCSDPAVISVTQTKPFRVKQNNPSLLACAVFCITDANCTHAIYREVEKEEGTFCLLIQLGTEFGLNSEAWLDENLKDCVVLLPASDDIRTQWKLLSSWTTDGFAEWKQMDSTTLRTMNYPQFLPLKVLKKNKYNQLITSSTFSLSSSGFFLIMMSIDRLIVSTEYVKFNEPFRMMAKLITETQDGKMYFNYTSFKTDGNVGRTKSQTFEGDLLVRNDFSLGAQNSTFIALHSLSLLRVALLNGYRHVPRGPYQSRVMMDTESPDIHFDTTEMFIASSDKDLTPPVYFTSVKESAMTGKRYEFRHQVYNGSNSFPCSETEQKDSVWVFESSWVKLEKPGHGSSETLIDVLKQNVLDGKELRMVMDGQISTDIVSSTITPSDLIFRLTKYLVPFKGVDSKNTSTQRVRFPIFGVRDKKLVECETDYQTAANGFSAHYESTFSSSVAWYVSKRKWNKIMEVNGRGEVELGCYKKFNRAITQGCNVRVCVLNTVGVTLCHGSPNVFSNPPILESPSMLAFSLTKDQALGDADEDCAQNYYLVSATGMIKSARFVTGSIDSNLQKELSYRKQTWFVECDVPSDLCPKSPPA